MHHLSVRGFTLLTSQCCYLVSKSFRAVSDRVTRCRLREAVASGQTREVKLAKTLPIYLLYLTAWVGPDDTVHFYPDVYGRDQVIADCVSPAQHPGRGQLA